MDRFQPPGVGGQQPSSGLFQMLMEILAMQQGGGQFNAPDAQVQQMPGAGPALRLPPPQLPRQAQGFPNNRMHSTGHTLTPGSLIPMMPPPPQSHPGGAGSPMMQLLQMMMSRGR